MNVNDLRMKRAATRTEAEKLVDASMKVGKDLAGRELAKFYELTATIKTISDKLDWHAEASGTNPEGQQTRPTIMGEGSDFQPQQHVATVGQVRGTSLREIRARATSAEREEIDAFTAYVSGSNITALSDLRPANDGAFFIPSLISTLLTRNYASFAPVRNAATVWSTSDGDPTTFPVISDSEIGAILLPSASTGADSIVSGNSPPTSITGPLMGAFKFSSKPVLVPRELQTDSSLGILDEILGALLARIIRLQNLKFTKGSGSGEPTGYMATATAYPAGAVALDMDLTLDLAYSVPALYRPNGIYMASDTTIKYLRKLKTGISGDKRQLWKDAFEEGNATLGTPAKLHGYPIIVNNDMDSVASDGTFAGVSPLAFGDFSRFIIREAEEGRPYIYRYPVPATDGTGVIAFQRADSRLVVPTAISKLTVS